MANKLSRRDFLKVGALGAASAIVAGCTPPATPTQAPAAPPATKAPEVKPTEVPPTAVPPKKPVTLDFQAWGDNADLPAWEKLVQLYQERNPHVTIKYSPVAEPNANFYPQLQTSIAGGTPPDVSSFQGWEWQTYADKGLLAPIDDFVKRDGFQTLYPQDVKGIMDTTVRKGATYLIPLQVATMLMFYARKPFDDAGIPYPTDDWTFEEFMEIAQKLTNTSGEKKMFGLQANGSWFRDIGWIRGTGKREFDSLVDPRKAQFNQPEIVEIVQKMAQDVIYTMKIAPSPADTSGGANTFQTGNCAMKYEGPWWFPAMNSPKLREEGKGIPFDVVLMPKLKDESRPHRGWAEGVALLKGDAVEEAWGFASFMASEEGDKIYSETTGRMPNNLALLESFWIPTVEEKFQFSNAKAFIEAFKRSQVDVIGGVPRSKMNAEVVKPLAYDKLVNNSATAAQVLPEVDKALQALLDEYWANA
ncbi:MAG: substrate-binding domain-containing protein [Anaerolineales bacterium]|nr:substrate-binding domain-containing protein [Anaerolineales bacterium]MDW8278171.1 substrate-binding domain-containing protein [Anaerolineales bacterium]